MFELTRAEVDRLIRTLDWILVSTLSTDKEQEQIKSIRNKLVNVAKCQPGKSRIKMFLSDTDETD